MTTNCRKRVAETVISGVGEDKRQCKINAGLSESTPPTCCFSASANVLPFQVVPFRNLLRLYQTPRLSIQKSREEVGEQVQSCHFNRLSRR